MPSPPQSTTTERTFLNARNEFQTMFGDLAKGKRNWQVIAFVSLALLGLTLTAYLYRTTTSHITPYVVEVDQFGRAVAFGPAERLRSTDRRLVIAQLATFLTNVRTIVPSLDAQRDLITRAYAFVDARGALFLNEYFASPGNDPRQLGTSMTRLVEINSVLPVPGAADSLQSGTWKLQWTETTIPTSAGSLRSTTAWEGYVTIRIVPPTRADVIELNPLGLYVTAITWSRLHGSTVPTLDGDPAL